MAQYYSKDTIKSLVLIYGTYVEAFYSMYIHTNHFKIFTPAQQSSIINNYISFIDTYDSKLIWIDQVDLANSEAKEFTKTLYANRGLS